MNPPKPTALRQLEGDPGHRAWNRREPEPKGGRVRCPARLTIGAQGVWRELAPQLKAMRLLTGADQQALATLCEDIVIDRFITTKLTEGTLLVQVQGAKMSHIRINPLFYQQAELRKRIMVALREFGLTPSSRSRIMIAKPDGKKHDHVLDGDWRKGRKQSTVQASTVQ